VFGAAAAAAKALKLSSGQTSHAIGLAGTYTGGIWSFIIDGAMSKRVHAGKAAEGGLVAALLAQQGVTGPEHLFEPGWGSFVSLYAGANADPDALLGGFDKPNLIFNSGFKPYACCRGCHSSLDAVLQLRSEHGFNLSSVDRIVVRASEHTARQLGKQDVANVLDA
jgi:2-methylcitrate dehydratase PrpD